MLRIVPRMGTRSTIAMIRVRNRLVRAAKTLAMRAASVEKIPLIVSLCMTIVTG